MCGRGACLGVVVLHAVGVGAPGEDGDLHLGHQGVVDGGVRQPESVRRPPVGDVGLEDLLCGRNTTQVNYPVKNQVFNFILLNFYLTR